MEMVTPDTGRDRDRAALYPVACQRQPSRPWAASAAAAVTNRATSRRRPDAVAGAARRRTGVIPCDRAAISWRFSLRSVARVYPNKSLPDTSHGTVLSTAAGACRAVLPPAPSSSFFFAAGVVECEAGETASATHKLTQTCLPPDSRSAVAMAHKQWICYEEGCTKTIVYPLLFTVDRSIRRMLCRI